MTTISVPISAKQADFIDSLIKSGKSANKAHAVRQALDNMAEYEAVQAILRAEKEPTLHGDLRELMKKI